VEEVSVTVVVPYLHVRTQDFDSVQVQVRLKVDPRQLGTDFYQNNTVGEKIEALPQIWREATTTGGPVGNQNPTSAIEYRSKAIWEQNNGSRRPKHTISSAEDTHSRCQKVRGFFEKNLNPLLTEHA